MGRPATVRIGWDELLARMTRDCDEVVNPRRGEGCNVTLISLGDVRPARDSISLAIESR